MINITDPHDCCGCTACMSICGHDAIGMVTDSLGFKYPKADVNKCVNCGLCDKVCAFNDNYDRSLNMEHPDIWAVRHKDMDIMMHSRSGAAFVALSDYILGLGGSVYGAGYVDHFRVSHKRATTPEGRDEFCGSKYSQSDLGSCFRQIKEELRAGGIVLFSGTPCQTAGLNSYVGKRLRKNLYLVDIICHGTPSPYIWRDYLAYMEKKYKTTFTEVDFRDKKKFGWVAHFETFRSAGKEVSTDTFRYLFYNHIMLRHSCSNCHYTNFERPSDVTLGDYWGWEKTDKNFNADNKGCSLVIVSTEKGREWFDKIKDQVSYIPVKQENCLQPPLVAPFPANKDRAQFEQDYVRHGFKFVLYKYGNVGPYYKAKQLYWKFKGLMRRIVGSLPSATKK